MIFDKYDNRKKKELIRLLKEKRRKEKKVQKELDKRAKTTYTTKYLKENKKLLDQNAMTIDKIEYEKMVMDMKKRLFK